MGIDDALMLLDEDSPLGKESENPGKWKILIVDDDEDIHYVTEILLDGFSFDGCGLEILNAYSGAEAKKLLEDHPDMALILLDVVMESDQAGLEVVKYVREELNNKNVRIVLRTGQPSNAPESSVIAEYDINDYKEKIDLTSQKLFTLMYAALRSYRDIMLIEESKEGLERIIEASSDLFEIKSTKLFAKGVLHQLTSLFGTSKNSVYVPGNGIVAAQNEKNTLEILAATGKYEHLIGKDGWKVLKPGIIETMERVVEEKKPVNIQSSYSGCFQSLNGTPKMFYIENVRQMDEAGRHLIDIFCRNVSIAFDNIELNQEIEDTQKEIVCRIGEAVEVRSEEIGNHLKRVVAYTEILARKIGIGPEETEIIKLASPLHDIGKIGIPDAVLNKPGKLDPGEWEVMKNHSKIGYEFLKNSGRRILGSGAIIANEHHEKWDGSGYPNNLRGEDIHIYGRIVAIADAFDVLGSARVYKEAWPLEKVLALFREERGRQFDPNLVDILFDHLSEFVSIGAELSDVA